VINKIYTSIRDLGRKYNLPTVGLSDVQWSDISEIITISNAIKNSSTPMFGSKMCHFLLPNLFPIYDSQIGESIGTSNYVEYWMICRQGWKDCTKKRIFKNILANEIGKNIISNYPWATKITELCCVGGGIVEKQIFNSSNQLIFGSVVTPSKEEIISYTQNNNRLRVGDVLISKLKGYHYVCIKVDGNEAKLLWIERKSGQPTGFYK